METGGAQVLVATERRRAEVGGARRGGHRAGVGRGRRRGRRRPAVVHGRLRPDGARRGRHGVGFARAHTVPCKTIQKFW